MANFKSDLGKLLHHALHPFRKSDPDDADIPAPPALNPTASIPALFIDDLDLSSLAQEDRAITPFTPFAENRTRRWTVGLRTNSYRN